VTILSTIIQNYADSKLRQQAEQRGTKTIIDALERQHNRYVVDLRSFTAAQTVGGG
jgi:hypothetical protein